MDVDRILSTGSRLVIATGVRLARKASRARRRGLKRARKRLRRNWRRLLRRARKRLRRNWRRLLRHVRSRSATTLPTLPERPSLEPLEERPALSTLPSLPTLTEEGVEGRPTRPTVPSLVTRTEEGLEETDDTDTAHMDASSILRIPDELLRRGDLDLVNCLFAEDYLMHDLESGKDFTGTDGYKEYATLIRPALADVLVSVHRQEVRGNRVVTHYTVRGTHTGRLLGRLGSGVAVKVSGRLVTRFAAGMIAEEWNSYDAPGLRRQLEAGGAARSATPLAAAQADVGR